MVKKTWNAYAVGVCETPDRTLGLDLRTVAGTARPRPTVGHRIGLTTT